MIGNDKFGYTMPVPRGAPMQPRQKPASSAGPGYRSYGQAPGKISDDRVADLQNNQMAIGASKGATAMQQMDRAGMSRGGGHRMRADMMQSLGDIEGRQQAAQTAMKANMANNQMQAEYDDTMRREELGNQRLLENLRSNKLNERLARQGWAQNVYEAMRRGQFDLDGIRPDNGWLYSALMED